MKKLLRLNTLVLLIILASCSNKASIREEVFYFDEEKTILAAKESYFDSILENGHEISLLHGEQIEYYENGQIDRKSNYHFDQLNGLQFQFTPEGDTTSVVSFLNGVQNGIKITAMNGYRTVSNYASGKLNGNYLKHTTYSEERIDTVEYGEYKKGKKEGVWVEAVLTYGLNHRFEGKHIYTYENGIKNGYCRFLSGWEGMVVNGRMDGRWVNSLDSTLSILIDNGELIAEEITGKEKPSIKTRGYIWEGYFNSAYGHAVETDRVTPENYIGYEYQEININFLESNYREDNWEIIKEKNYRNHTIVDHFSYAPEFIWRDNILGRYYYPMRVGEDRNDSIIIDFRYNIILNLRVSKLDYSDKQKRKELYSEGVHNNTLRRLKETVNVREYLISSVQDTGVFEYQKLKIDSEKEINCIFSLVSAEVKGSGNNKEYIKTNFYIDSQFNCYKKEATRSTYWREREVTRGDAYKLRCVEKRYDEEENTLYLKLEGINSNGNWGSSRTWVINLSRSTLFAIQGHCSNIEEVRAFWGATHVRDKREYYGNKVEACEYMLEENETFGINHLVMDKIQAIKEREY